MTPLTPPSHAGAWHRRAMGTTGQPNNYQRTMCSVFEVTFSGEDHGHAGLVCGSDYFVVAD